MAKQEGIAYAEPAGNITGITIGHLEAIRHIASKEPIPPKLQTYLRTIHPNNEGIEEKLNLWQSTLDANNKPLLEFGSQNLIESMLFEFALVGIVGSENITSRMQEIQTAAIVNVYNAALQSFL